MSAEKTESKSPSRSGKTAAGKGRPRKPDKPHTWLSDELGTSLVAEATYSPDHDELCKRYNVRPRTLERWRAKCGADPRLRAMVAEKESGLAEVWDAGIKTAARDLLLAIQHHARLAQKSERFEPEVMHKCAGALKVLNDAVALRGVLPNVHRPASSNRKDSPAAAPAGVGGEPRTGDRAAGGPVH